eukprot:gene9152-10103_t
MFGVGRIKGRKSDIQVAPLSIERSQSSEADFSVLSRFRNASYDSSSTFNRPRTWSEYPFLTAGNGCKESGSGWSGRKEVHLSLSLKTESNYFGLPTSITIEKFDEYENLDGSPHDISSAYSAQHFNISRSSLTIIHPNDKIDDRVLVSLARALDHLHKNQVRLIWTRISSSKEAEVVRIRNALIALADQADYLHAILSARDDPSTKEALHMVYSQMRSYCGEKVIVRVLKGMKSSSIWDRALQGIKGLLKFFFKL